MEESFDILCVPVCVWWKRKGSPTSVKSLWQWVLHYEINCYRDRDSPAVSKEVAAVGLRNFNFTQTRTLRLFSFNFWISPTDIIIHMV